MHANRRTEPIRNGVDSLYCKGERTQMMMGAEPTRDVFDEVRRTLDGDTEPSRTLGGMTPGERLRAEIGALNDRLVFLESEHLRSRERLEHMARALTAAGVDPATV